VNRVICVMERVTRVTAPRNPGSAGSSSLVPTRRRPPPSGNGRRLACS